MKLTCGIVGLPNVGKSTIFSALTKAPAEAANYPFCTIDPNIGIVDLPDERLDFMASVFQPKKKIPATVDFVDIAGLIKAPQAVKVLEINFLQTSGKQQSLPMLSDALTTRTFSTFAMTQKQKLQ